MHLSIILDPRADVLHAENAAEMAALYHRLLTDAARYFLLSDIFFPPK